MITNRLTWIVIAAMLTSACASTAPATQQLSYAPGNAPAVNNKIVIDKTFDDAWNDMIKRMTVSQYRINNIEKVSRIINLEYQIEDPNEVNRYIDCGTITNRITFKGETRTFTYSHADSRPYELVSADNHFYWREIQPRSTLGGTVNVYMSPLDAQRTEISVNVRYRVARSFTGTVYSQRRSGEYLRDGPQSADPQTVVLTTQQPGRFDYHGNQVVCHSTGFIEKQFLDYARQ